MRAMQKDRDPVTFYARSTWGSRMALSTDSCEINTQLSSRGVRDVSAVFLLSSFRAALQTRHVCYRAKRSKRLCREATHVHPILLARCTIADSEPSVRACRVQNSNSILHSGACHIPNMLLLASSLHGKEHAMLTPNSLLKKLARNVSASSLNNFFRPIRLWNGRSWGSLACRRLEQIHCAGRRGWLRRSGRPSRRPSSTLCASVA